MMGRSKKKDIIARTTRVGQSTENYSIYTTEDLYLEGGLGVGTPGITMFVNDEL